MGYIHHDRNNEQVRIPIASHPRRDEPGFNSVGKNAPKPGEGLKEFGEWEIRGLFDVV